MSSLRDLIIDTARKEIGVKEMPENSNLVKYNDWFYMKSGVGLAWCGTFVSWVFNESKIPLGVIDYSHGFASVPFAVNHISKFGKQVTVPMKGDIVMFDWDGDGKFDHTGIFEKDLGKGLFQSIEGNTSVGNDSNGGTVMVRQRKYKFAIFIRPNVFGD